MTKATKAQQDTQAKAQEGAPVEGAPKALGIEALAEACGAAPKDVRRWLRAQARAIEGGADTLPGKGGRYAFTPAHVEALARAYSTTKGAKGTHAPADAIVSALTSA